MKKAKKVVMCNVTAEHIERGVISKTGCPIALALQDKGLPFSMVMVTSAGVTMSQPCEGETIYKAPLSRRARLFVKRYDDRFLRRKYPPRPSRFKFTFVES